MRRRECDGVSYKMSIKANKFIKDVLFPVFCVECGEEGKWLCETCLRRCKFEPILRCPGCGKKNNGELCLGCRGFFCLDGAAAFIEYKESGASGRLIVEFKYHYARDVMTVWQKIIEQAEDFLTPLLQGTTGGPVFIPVPLYPRRERERGYNQAAIIAEIIMGQMQKNRPGCDWQIDSKSLIRFRPTDQQAKLSKEERAKNVAGAFAWRESRAPENVIIVDDVFTSGATLEECARVLKNAGVKKVIGLTLARAI